MIDWERDLLELLNGMWAIAAFSLMIICGFYLQHEARARSYRWSRGWREMMTSGMRVAVAVGAIAMGSTIRSGSIFFWYVGGGHTDLSRRYILWGTIVAVSGFVCAVREFSSPIYGSKPWQVTLLAIVIFAVTDLSAHLL